MRTKTPKQETAVLESSRLRKYIDKSDQAWHDELQSSHCQCEHLRARKWPDNIRTHGNRNLII